MKKERISCEIARNFSCLKALENAGHFPIRKSEKEAWFLSPLRSETQASFKVSLNLNRWYDHGAGIGGNVIDLICLINQCSVKEALIILDQDHSSFSFQQPASYEKEKGIEIVKAKHLQHPALIQYLKSRRIPLQTAMPYCKEVHYVFRDKRYFAIGLKNISGGYELRNKFYKNSSSPKDITMIKNGKKNLVICEGMFDLLSLASLHKNLSQKTDILVLNSISFIGKAILEIENYNCVELYLDRDNAGAKATKQLLKSSSKCIDMSSLYQHFCDINDWWIKREKGKV